MDSLKLCSFEVGNAEPIFLIAGPCVIESEGLALETSARLKEITGALGVPFIYKTSFDKANRSSHTSYRGPGLEQGLRILQRVRDEVGVPVLTDVHEDTPLDEVADVVSVLQTPAFLCRQTNFIQNVCRHNRPVNIKKGQFLAPADMNHVVNKARATGNPDILVCERGVTFGYNNLVSDMRSIPIMRATGCPVVFDATHSVQMPGGLGRCLGRAAGNGAGIGAGGGGGRGRGNLHGNASQARRSALRRAKFLADGPDGRPYRRPPRNRRRS